MIGRIVVLLLCLGLAIAPAGAADDGGSGGSCVWTSRENGNLNAGVNANECTSSGGQWDPERGD